MVLGPSKWLDPERVRSNLSESPLVIRRQLSDLCASWGLHSFLMEDHEKEKGESNTALFTRIIKENDVRHFLVFWPIGARLLGLEKEAGDLLRWLNDERLAPSQVYLLVEKTMADDDESEGMGALNEPQNRTRYHTDFLSYEVPVRFWDDMDSLFSHTVAFAAEAQLNDAPKWHHDL